MINSEQKTSKLKEKRRLGRVFLGSLTVIILLTVLVFGHSLVYAQKILPRVEIAGVNTGGLSQEAAREKLKQKIPEFSDVQFHYQDSFWKLKTEDLGISFDIDSSVTEAFNLGKTGNFISRLVKLGKSLFANQIVPLKYTIDEEKLFQSVSQEIGLKIEDQELETKLTFQNGRVVIIEGRQGQRIDREDLKNNLSDHLNSPQQDREIIIVLIESEPKVTKEGAELALSQAQQIVSPELKLKSPEKEFSLDSNLIGSWIESEVIKNNQADSQEPAYILSANLDKSKVLAYVQALAKEVNRQPANARITMEAGAVKVINASAPGLTLKENETEKKIIETLLARKSNNQSNEVNLVIEEIAPEISTENVTDLGIKELIGAAATDFSTSPDNRKHNIGVGATALSGTIVKDGEEYSALKLLGKVDASQGYLPELVINNNKLEADLGGGLCQNATTLFRAVIDAGLPVTARQNHSRRVSYYEKTTPRPGVNLTFDNNLASVGSSLVGYDATVFVPQPDLKFKNDTGKAILVQQFIEGNLIITEIYGTKDGRKPSITKAEILSTKPTPATIYHSAPDLAKGVNKQLAKGVSGAKTKFTYTITYQDGRNESQEFISNYRAIAPEVQVGAKEEQPAPTQ